MSVVPYRAAPLLHRQKIIPFRFLCEKTDPLLRFSRSSVEASTRPFPVWKRPPAGRFCSRLPLGKKSAQFRAISSDIQRGPALKLPETMLWYSPGAPRHFRELMTHMRLFPMENSFFLTCAKQRNSALKHWRVRPGAVVKCIHDDAA